MKKIFLLFLSFFLCSCASTHYGNLTEMDISKEDVLARDAVAQIYRLHLPARTTFKIYQPIDNAFGQKLVQHLRAKGYGVQENTRPKSMANFYYVVDRVERSKSLRVTIFIGQQEISRAYALKKGHVIPRGTWSHKE